MRAGASAPHQTLSAEAASVLKHSLTLARRRGHAQLTPLHVAATLLTSRSSLLRRACQPPHPLQGRALELCFNVALNRLPGPLLHAQPSLSNALVAALKRAQAHQRRGCIEQQQPLIAVKVELEQLILSILDDPSVSRVMREAGLSSTSVKNNLEADSNLVSSVFQSYNSSSGGIYSTPNSPPTESHRGFWQSHLLSYAKPPTSHCTNEDINVVFQVLVGKKRRNTVIIGDSVSTSEALVSELMRKVEYGVDVPDELKSTQLVKFQLSSVPLMFMNKEEVEMNVADLKRKVESRSSGGRVIIYIGDLKWAVDERENVEERYNPIDHLIVEIGKLVGLYNSTSMRVWLIATANYQTYIKCQMKQPPLDVQWALQPVSLPSGGLGLSLNATSGRDNSRITYSENSSPVAEKKLFRLEDELTCCQECISNYDKEAASPQLPYWLNSRTPLQKEDLDQLRRKYNKLCQSLHQSSSYPGRNQYWPNKKNIFADSETISFVHPSLKPNQAPPSSLPRFRRQQSCHIEFSFSNGSPKNQSDEPNLDSLKHKEDKITLALGNPVYTQKTGEDVDIYRVFKENVPWQSSAFPLIIEALKEDKVILMQGNDSVGKRRLAIAIAESVFGSSEFLVRMNMRTSDKTGSENREMLERALRNHAKVVVLLEDVDFGDPLFLKFVCEKIEKETSNVVFVLTMDETRREEVKSVIQMRLLVGAETTPNLDCKRKRANEMEEVSSDSIMNQIRELKRKLNTSGLDLNIKADEDEGKEGGEFSPISSDLTRETTVEEHKSLGFISKIKKRVVLNLCLDQEREAKGMFLMKLRRAFQEGSGCKSVSDLNVDEAVLEEVLRGAGSYLNSLYEEWLKEVFQTSLRGVNSGEREKVSFRLCLVGKGECGAKDGFKGTSLPKRIPVSFIG